MTELISIIMVSFNSRHVLGDCLRPIVDDGRWEIIVVDNNSSDSSAEFVEENFPTVTVLRHGYNAGFATAVNFGARHATGDRLFLLNPDAIISEAAIRLLSATLDGDLALGAVSPLVTDPEGEFVSIGAGRPPTIWRMFLHASGLSRLSRYSPRLEGNYLFPFNLTPPITHVDWASGGCLLVRRSVWEELGGLTERWFMYAEDIDLCLRIRAAGHTIGVVSDAVALHQVGGSSSTENGRVSTVWIENLYDLYSWRLAPTRMHAFAWRHTVAAGFRGRTVAYRLLARGRAGARAHYLANAHRFELYATALLGAGSAVRGDRAAATPRRARYYDVARVAHIERLDRMVPADFFYVSHRADWDDALARSTPAVRKVSFTGFLAEVWRTPYDTIEIPEPLAVPLIPKLSAIAIVLLLKRAVTRERTGLVAYAIENLDAVEKISTRFRLPQAVARIALRVLLRPVIFSLDRLAFGTQGAKDNYRDLFGAGLAAVSERVFPALPAPSAALADKDPMLLCYLGAFETRKGIEDVLAAWPLVRAHMPYARLSVLGHGPLEREVRAVVDRLEGVSITVDPPRGHITETLRHAHALVLPSRRTPTWREQVGLPIVEALAEGCEIVTSSETGLASWLLEHGHRIVSPPALPAELAGAIVAALQSTRSASDIRSQLPDADSRLDADTWLMASSRGGAAS